MKKSLLIIDFDNTLFQTRSFWRLYLFPFYEKIGIKRAGIEAAFEMSVTKKVDYFVPKYFIDELYAWLISIGEKKFSKKELWDTFNLVYKPKARTYFYKDALKLLAIARKKDYQIALVSYGDRAFKKKFFKALGLFKYILSKNILIVDNTNKKYSGDIKIKFLSSRYKKLTNYQKIDIVNDNDHPEEIWALYEWARKSNAELNVYVVDHSGTKILSREKQFKYCNKLTSILCQL